MHKQTKKKPSPIVLGLKLEQNPNEMNADIFFHIATYSPVHELLHDWTAVCKQWKAWLLCSAANVRLWMSVTEYSLDIYCKERGLASFSPSFQAYQQPIIQHKINWRIEAMNILRHVIANSYVEHVQFDNACLYKIPRNKKAIYIETDTTKWYYYAPGRDSEHFVLVKSSHEPISKTYDPSTGSIRRAVLGFDHTNELWMIERNPFGSYPFCSKCHSLIAPTETDVSATNDGIYCKHCK